MNRSSGERLPVVVPLAAAAPRANFAHWSAVIHGRPSLATAASEQRFAAMTIALKFVASFSSKTLS